MKPRPTQLLLAVLALLSSAAALAASQAPAGVPLAWMRFTDAPQEYQGTRYLFLGDGELQLNIDLPPAPGQALDLHWGAKGDTREAVAVINGREVPLRKGGYDGFEWLRVPLPPGTSGRRLEVLLRAGAGKAAFLSEVRLVAPDCAEPLPANLSAPAFHVSLKRGPAPQAVPGGEAFPEMRALWDREPAYGKPAGTPAEAAFRQAERNARLAAEALYRCRRYVDGWLAHADPKCGLIPRNLGESRDLWNGRDSAADNYPFMVLTCALTDRPLFEGRMREMLRTETRLTCRVDRLADDIRLSTQTWAREKVNLDAILFDSSEYVKDGLLPLTEWLGPSPWSERMTAITEDVWKNAAIDTPFGKIPTLNFEVNGDLLQACSRLYWFTGERKYLDWAIRLGDYYLLGDHHPTRDLPSLRLVDHGCEVVNGLSELYVAVSVADPPKREAYRKPIHEMLDCILARGRNEDGMLYGSFNPKTHEHSRDLCDTWGYDYDAFYTVSLLDKDDTYREAVRHALGNLKGKYVGAPWGDKSADGYADSIEGAINLLNREPVPSAADWIDSQTRLMWAKQHPDGVIEGWHGDGNFARTSILYALWKTQGATIQPWRADVRVGAARDGNGVSLSLAADAPWHGTVIFDRPRHKENLRLPLDYPRINQFPEWFTVDADSQYAVTEGGAGGRRVLTGKELREGLALDLGPGVEVRWKVEPFRPAGR